MAGSGVITVGIFLFGVATLAALADEPRPVFIWYMYPLVRGKLYGYIPEKNESILPQRIVGAVVSRRDEGIIGAYLAENQTGSNKIILGTLQDTCIGNIAACERFSISFLCKVWHPLPLAKWLRFFISSPWQEARTGSHPIMIGTVTGAVDTTIQAAVGRHGSSPGQSDGIRYRSRELSHWTSISLVFNGPLHSDHPELYVNGTKTSTTPYEINLRNPSNSEPLLFTIGDDAGPSDMSISWFQVFNGSLTEEQVGNLSERMLQSARQADQVSVKLSPSTVRVDEAVGTVPIMVERTGNVELASVVRFTATEGSAKRTEDFTFDNVDDFIFMPGEIYHSLNVTIVSDDYTEGEDSFTVSVTSLDGVTSTDLQGTVTITITNHTGIAGVRPQTQAQSQSDDDTIDTCQLLLILLAIAIGLATLGIIIVIIFAVAFLCR